jgi:IS30 family transposase
MAAPSVKVQLNARPRKTLGYKSPNEVFFNKGDEVANIDISNASRGC